MINNRTAWRQRILEHVQLSLIKGDSRVQNVKPIVHLAYWLQTWGEGLLNMSLAFNNYLKILAKLLQLANIHINIEKYIKVTQSSIVTCK